VREHELKQSGQPALTPEQPLEQKRKADEKRLLELEKSHPRSATKSPALPI
jgi:hypothetical protein